MASRESLCIMVLSAKGGGQLVSKVLLLPIVF